MGKLGNTLSTYIPAQSPDVFTGDGTKTSFGPLQASYPNANAVNVNINGISQQVAAYSISGTNIVFTAAPANGDIIEVRGKYAGNNVLVPGPNSISNSMVQGGTLTKDRLATPYYAVKMTRASAYTTPAATNTVIPVDTVIFDSSGLGWANAATNRIQPTIAGYYQVTGQVDINPSASTDMMAFLYKNASLYCRGTRVSLSGNTGLPVSDVVFLNGVTDYVQLAVYTSSAQPLEIISGSQNFISLIGPF